MFSFVLLIYEKWREKKTSNPNKDRSRENTIDMWGLLVFYWILSILSKRQWCDKVDNCKLLLRLHLYDLHQLLLIQHHHCTQQFSKHSFIFSNSIFHLKRQIIRLSISIFHMYRQCMLNKQIIIISSTKRKC